MILIGEKLNGFIPPVGRAIRARDEETLRALARAQADGGADYLDLCTGPDCEPEAETLAWLVRLIEETVDIPVCLDSANPETLAAVLPLCKRPGIVNSVSLERDKIKTIFPLIADTPWRCVALLCTDEGVPETAEGRVEIFEHIRKQADDYGIAHERLFIDPVVHALATDGAAATTLIACTREIRRRSAQVHIVCGLPNISFGLPASALINRAFLVLAMEAGLDAAIMNAADRELVGLAYAAEALLGRDEYCLDFITAYREGRVGPVKTPNTRREESV